MTAAAWLPDSKLFVTGSLGKTIFLHVRLILHILTNIGNSRSLTRITQACACLGVLQNLDGEIAFSWRGPRVVDLAVDAEGKKLVVASQDKRLLVYRFGSDTEEA